MEYTFNVAQAAQEMGVCTKEVLGLIKEGKLPAAQMGKGFIIRKSDVFKRIDQAIALETTMRQRNPQSPEPKRGRKRNAIPVI